MIFALCCAAKLPMEQAFHLADDVLRQAVQELRIDHRARLINVDLPMYAG